jgi:hypothetical protein
MFRKDSTVGSAAFIASPLGGWPSFAENETVADITPAGFEFGPQDASTAARCAYINALLMDTANGV